ncbi:phosphatidylglycerophosphate synthase [Albidovulum inexpectatum]|uniref:Phosphatidylglycerophosphate synthase n=1 Tax=Albidovulum inexpectatum TaxID=196587 RepID=A0A2S5JG35_9RHOB|nr:CDP-alcohol phosphatidyltransferase family protein [Albidovulum inexpectatum]PPB80467.1 phosphatidylglycerophosphate synthase [Albidovulum inexpectatum]
MIDRHLVPLVRQAVRPVARILVRAGISADQVSILGFALGVGGAAALALGAHGAGLALILLNRLADALDGEIARLTTPTDRGAFLDIALDFLFYALVPLGFAIVDPSRNALPACVLIASFVGTGSSFLAFATIAERRGMRSLAFPTKGIYYLGGLTEGAETIALFVAMCLWPQGFPILAYGFALLCAVTTLTRWHHGWTAFTPQTETVAPGHDAPGGVREAR